MKNALELRMPTSAGVLNPRKSGRGPFRVTDSILGAGGLDYALYDSSALDRMWHESTGQTPAVLASPVGLIVGREKQAAKTFAQVMAGQPNLISNGSFADSVLGWDRGTSTGDATIAAVAGGARAVTNSDGSYSGLRATSGNFVPVIGKSYMVSVDVISIEQGQVVLDMGGTSGIGGVLVVGRNIRYVMGVVTNGSPIFKRNAGQSIYTINNVVVKEIPAHYAAQATGVARPTLQADGFKFDGSDDNLLTDVLAGAGSNCLIAQVAIPASLTGTQTIVGAQTSDRVRLDIYGQGGIARVAAALGPSTSPAVGPDLLGKSAIVAFSFDGTTQKLFVDGIEVYSAAQAGPPPTTMQLALGAVNVNNVRTQFYGGAIKRAAIGRVALTSVTATQINAEWLAAA